MNISTLLGANPPAAYATFLRVHTECESFGDVLLYGSSDIAERNATYEVLEYCPGFLTIGDDGGGQAIMLDLANGAIKIVDHGSMDPDCMVLIADEFSNWLSQGCPLPFDDDDYE